MMTRKITKVNGMLEFSPQGKTKNNDDLLSFCCRFILFSLYDFKICPTESLARKLTFIGILAHMGFMLGRRV